MRLLLRQYKIIAVAIIVCLVPAVASISFQEPEYQAVTRIYVDVETTPEASSYALSQANRLAQIRTITFKALVPSRLILDDVVTELNLDVTAEQLAPAVSAVSALDTSIIDINVVWDEPRMAAKIANSIADEMISELGSDQQQGATALVLEQAQPAVVPKQKATPNAVLLLGLAGFGGLLLGSAIVLIIQGYRRRIYSAQQIAPLTSAPLLGVVSPGQPNAIAHIAKTLTSAERFAGVRTIAVVSPGGHREKTDVAAQLSSSLPADFVVVDSPARLALREPVDNPASMDGALVVVTLGRDSEPDLTTTLTQLELLGVSVTGVIVTTSARRSARAGAPDAG